MRFAQELAINIPDLTILILYNISMLAGKFGKLRLRVQRVSGVCRLIPQELCRVYPEEPDDILEDRGHRNTLGKIFDMNERAWKSWPLL